MRTRERVLRVGVAAHSGERRARTAAVRLCVQLLLRVGSGDAGEWGRGREKQKVAERE